MPKSNNHSVIFGPLSLELEGKLIIKDLVINAPTLTLQFSGNNGTGKSTVMELIRRDLIENNKSVAYINQNYRASWLWFKTARQNLELSYAQRPKTGNEATEYDKKIAKKRDINDHKSVSLYDSAIWKRNAHWVKPLLEEGINETKRSIFFERDVELATVELSGGQLQRLIVFRELLHSPDFVLLDEAFSALDEDITLDIIKLIKQEQSFRPFVVVSITHNQNVRQALGGTMFTFVRDPNSFLLSITEESAQVAKSKVNS